MITRDDLNWWLELESRLDWRFATTYAASAPHEYVIADKTPGFSQADAARAAHVIRTFGQPGKFYKTTRIYLTTPRGLKHWDMQRGLIDDARVTLINRCHAGHVYGPQTAPRTASGRDSAYDALATTWDREHAMTESERAQTAELIRDVFGSIEGRVLDLGCGTGWPIDAGLVDAVRYVGIDSSTAMLNALVIKHPHVAAVHPMTVDEAREREVLGGSRYDAVLALGGSASHLGEAELSWARSVTDAPVLLMHYAEADAVPGMDATTTAERLRLVVASGARSTRIGRFVATVLTPRIRPR